MNFFQIDREIPGVDPEVVFSIGNFPIANSFLLIVGLVILFIIFGIIVSKTFRIVPKTFQNIVEVIYDAIVELIQQITGSRSHAEKVFALVATIFVYIGVANLITFIPGITSITYNGISLFRTPTSDFNTTFGLAFAMVLLIQIISVRDWGIVGYLGRYFKFKEIYLGFKEGISAGFTAIIEFFVGLLDIISEVAKIVSLSLRLFGNIYAGEVLAILVLGALAYLLPSLWMTVNMLFALVQTVVFGSLVTAYYMIAIKPRENADEE